MDRLLDLHTMINENKTREHQRLDIFKEILDQCHSQIRRFNRDHKVRECYFSIPIIKFGKPLYQLDVLVNYLLYHLHDNGLYAEYLKDRNQIYISWKDEDIDIDRYEQRKKRIKQSVLREKPVEMKAGDGTSVFIDMTGPVNRTKVSQAKKIQAQREREFRDTIQNQRVAPTKSFKDFIRSF